MKTEIIFPEKLHLAAVLLKQGELVAFPTETVYGLGASVFDPAAVNKIFSVKGRAADNPLIAHVESVEQASLLGDDLPPSFFRLAEMFWPGPLTLVVKRKSSIPAAVSAGHSTIAIRMPVHAVALQLIREAGVPLAAPSANLSGRPSPTCVQDVLEDLDGRIPLVVDGGACSIGIESTVLSLASVRPVLLRPGAIHKAELEEALGCSIDEAGKETPIHSPGMKYRHYAPRAKVSLVFDEQQLAGPHTLSHVTSRNLYAELRRMDRLGAEEIQIFCSPSVQTDEALMNRLLRATGLE